MKILVVHNCYRQRGGEDAVVDQEVELLTSAGHDIIFHAVSNDTISGIQSSLKTFANASYNRNSRNWMSTAIGVAKPDVVHIHNFFPLLSPSIHEAAAQAGVAVVQTLHNYRTICAGATLLRGEQACRKCVQGHRVWGAVHRCYRHSLPASLAVVAMQMRADRRKTWHRHVHRFIALSEHGRSLFEAGGLPADRIVVKPHFVPATQMSGGGRARRGVLFVGRVAPEKGVTSLVEAWRHLPDIPLTVVGDGPLRSRLQSGAPPGITFTGELPTERVKTLMQAAQLLVAPSIAPEPFGLVVVEAFASGLPVLASASGAFPALVQTGRNGALFRPGDPEGLAAQVRRLLNDPEGLRVMGHNARTDHETHYTPERNLELLESIYRDAIALARKEVAC